MSKKKRVKVGNRETYLFMLLFGLLFGYLAYTMGINNMFSTLMNTAHELLLNTILYIMAIAVLSGALGGLLVEFGVVAWLNNFLIPFIEPIFKMPGATAIGGLTTYLSDNPAIISLVHDTEFRKYFKEYQIPVLCNFGTAFGMGLIVTSFMIGKGFFFSALIGNLGAIIGCIVSSRLMLYYSKKELGESSKEIEEEFSKEWRFIRDGNVSFRFLEAFLEGGKMGVEIGLSIIPGVLVICTLIMILTFGPANPEIGYQGLAFEGVGLLPKIGKLLFPILKPLFGFTSPEAIAVPVTALGAVGAALGLIPKFLEAGLIGGGDIAVFTAMGMCWSGYLSTHVAMMDALGYRQLTTKAILSHTIGGLAAGISANLLYHLVLLLI
ncbi:hypothetical protein BBF96_04510 [Anoxybacter fermentans]|uniref:Transporter gate domain protein n=1 Tax=Anoxybacter fermentans TaxID=1323375 RepID=A0A3Q9HSQ3_9FIRM|nr:hypothetical protein BBF96_04510 [Anoxybacter fermentans]